MASSSQRRENPHVIFYRLNPCMARYNWLPVALCIEGSPMLQHTASAPL